MKSILHSRISENNNGPLSNSKDGHWFILLFWLFLFDGLQLFAADEADTICVTSLSPGPKTVGVNIVNACAAI
jgi:hypothetical protein